MTHPVRSALSILIALALVVSAAAATAAPSETPQEGKRYVCPPCGMDCDQKVFDRPGRCPACGARLVEQASRKKAAILIFEGVQIIDYTGPYEVLGQGGFEVFTVAGTKATLTTSMGMKVVPEHTFADAPRADVLVVPGGNVDGPRKSAATLKWVKEASAAAQHTLSVCNGAFILASAGLLDGLGATTFHRMIDDLKAEYPKTRVVSDQRFVDNGRIITTAGLSSGIDGALHLLSRMLGRGKAQTVALNMEYDWRPDSRYARAALADRLIPDIDLDRLGEWSIVSTQGTTETWDIVVRGTTDLGRAELLDRVGQAFAKQGKWSGAKRGAAAVPSTPRTDWTFSGPDGRRWAGTLGVEAVTGRDKQYTLSLHIARLG
ncbi:MAG TPA: DJ-1/PfpI family protein [Candidatus Polarisedimenticolia bacterium]|nr:DJ-1/PfpI family protein [Candidatus Polarisedimenticolia bacterium]